MVRITKVYTRTGDKGETSLAKGRRIAKTSLRIQAIGCLDELNSMLGWSIVIIKDHQELGALYQQAQRIQQELFNLGAELAVLPDDRHQDTPVIHSEDTKRLENEIDNMNHELAALTSFILPGGNEITSRLHITRAVCRRTEIALINLAQQDQLDGVEIPYINRLSDWLFVAARFVGLKTNVQEIFWKMP